MATIASASSTVKARWNSASSSAAASCTNASSIPTRRSATIVIAVVVTIPYSPIASGPSSAVASSPWTSTSASAPARNAALTTQPRAVAARRPPGRLALLLRGMGRDATPAMRGAPPLIVSYFGLLGGSERILLDGATPLRRRAIVACPAGRLAAAAGAAGLAWEPVRERPLRRNARGLAGLARETTRLVRRQRPTALVAWGARA